jgi:four helix bundle protein
MINVKSKNLIDMKDEKTDLRPHRKLEVWKMSMDFVKEIYLITDRFPDSELYGLTSQMRRAAISVPSNLAEGAARKSGKKFKQFLNVAQGSISELDTQIELSLSLSYINEEEYSELMKKIIVISKMLYGLSRSIK